MNTLSNSTMASISSQWGLRGWSSGFGGVRDCRQMSWTPWEFTGTAKYTTSSG